MKNLALATTGLVLALSLTACNQQSEAAGNDPAPGTKTDNVKENTAPLAAPIIDDPWAAIAEQTLAKNLAKAPIKTRAKNVILFIGDGMDPTTVTAGRIYDGQDQGLKGEDNVLAMESLPHLALSKTYSASSQTPDSAATATAMMTGTKTRSGVLNVRDNVPVGDCEAGLAGAIPSLGEMAAQAKMAVGVVSTARLTHATPATVYAHSASRGWESDKDLPEGTPCKDIASQLLEFSYGDGIAVAMGGGRRNFLPADLLDPEYANKKGSRKDGRNLTEEWLSHNPGGAYIWNEEQFAALPASTTRLLGLFEPSHMQYELDRPQDGAGEPSLADMTAKAIDILDKDEDGFFLMVEGGRIDHAHHAGNAARALADLQAFDEAVAVALEKVDLSETLVIVTADHGHTISFGGYPQRGNPILGVVVSTNPDGSPASEPYPAGDGKAYTTLTYANGPGAVFGGGDAPVTRPDVTMEEAHDPDYMQQALIPSRSETHGGQDVIIFAGGPDAYLFDGVVEQNYIFHVMEHALGLKERLGELSQ